MFRNLTILAVAWLAIGFASWPVRAQEPAPVPQAPFQIAPLPSAGPGYSMLPYWQEDAIVMHRSAGGFDAANIQWAAGPRLVLGIPIGEATAVEFGYFGLYNMNASAFAPAPISANLGGVIGTAINSRADYRSVVNNGELNVRHWLAPRFSLLAGFRYLNWHEDLNAAFDPVNPFGGAMLPPGSANTIFHTSNNLYGFQLGGNWNPMLTERFGIDLGGKAGVFGAQSALNASAALPGFGTFAANASGTRTAFVGEIGLLGTYNCTPYLKLRAGYQVIWIDGLALAPDQISSANFGGTSSVSNRAGVFLHGAVFGLEYRW